MRFLGAGGKVGFGRGSSLSETFYIGGSFQGTYGGDHLSFWDGSKWNPLGDPNDTVFEAIFDSNENLYIAGNFTAVGGVSANRIAKWNGTQWSSLGSGLNNTPGCLAVDSNDNVYVGGNFTTAGGTTVNRIAKWNGSAWSSLATDGMNAFVYSLAFDSSDNLYAGGFFTTANGVTVNYIAKWNGTQWSSLGSGMNNSVYDLIFDSSGDLYATGAFTTSGGTTTNAIAKWNVTTETWSGFGSGVGNSFNIGTTIMFLNGELVAGGSFISPLARIVKWNGTAWENSFGFPNNRVYGLTPTSPTSNTFYANGIFTNLGNSDGDRIAYWNGSSWENLGRGNGLSMTERRGSFDSNGNLFFGSYSVFLNNNYLRFLSVRNDILSETPQ